MLETPAFLTLVDVVEIHKNQIKLYGGQHGIREMSLLQSAIAQPEASFAGEWLHADIYEMAAAYAYHICMNHPFFDGNKRAALATSLVFLEINDVPLLDPKGVLSGIMLKMAEGALPKREFASLLKGLPKE